LYYHCTVYHLFRTLAKDNAIPLSHPIITKAGAAVSEIPIAQGQVVMPNLAVYNRCVSSLRTMAIVASKLCYDASQLAGRVGRGCARMESNAAYGRQGQYRDSSWDVRKSVSSDAHEI
jgi:hypothetical protein